MEHSKFIYLVNMCQHRECTMVLFMEHNDANWILDFGATTHVTRNPRLLDEVKPHIGSPSRIKLVFTRMLRSYKGSV
jgi:hypothetical protein